MIWTKQVAGDRRSPAGQVANQLNLAGHVNLDDIRTVTTMGTQHAIVALRSDTKHWYYWFWDVEINVWTEQGKFTSLAAAKQAAEVYETGLVSIARQEVIDGTAGMEGAAAIVIARWVAAPYFNEDRENAFMTVPCSSPYTAGVIGEIFKRLGCSVDVEELEKSSP